MQREVYELVQVLRNYLFLQKDNMVFVVKSSKQQMFIGNWDGDPKDQFLSGVQK